MARLREFLKRERAAFRRFLHSLNLPQALRLCCRAETSTVIIPDDQNPGILKHRYVRLSCSCGREFYKSPGYDEAAVKFDEIKTRWERV